MISVQLKTYNVVVKAVATGEVVLDVEVQANDPFSASGQAAAENIDLLNTWPYTIDQLTTAVFGIS